MPTGRLSSFSTCLFLAFLLAGCGPDDTSTGSAGSVVIDASAAVEPIPTDPDPGPDNTPLPNEPATAVVDDAFPVTAEVKEVIGDAATSGGEDYTYPRQPALMMDDATFDPAAKQVHIRVYLTAAPATTVIARVFTKNGSGANYMYSGGNYTAVKQTLIFRPGDPLEQTVTIPIKKAKVGGHFVAYMPSVPSGAQRGTQSIKITAVAGALNQPITWRGRQPRTFIPAGQPTYNLYINGMRWSNNGAAGVWRTSLAHGRVQPANGETGLYLDPDLHLTAEPPIVIRNGQLVLHSQRLNSPIAYAGLGNGAGAGNYNYGAVVLNGYRSPETHIRYGQIEWQAMMPGRRGSWPALWLIGVNGWPPEIDVYEGFNSNASFDGTRMASGTIHGGPTGTRIYARGYSEDVSTIYGIEPTLTTDFHSYAIDIQPDYITWFIDGVEVFQAVNKFKGKFYPLMNVAVKTTGAYAEGSGDMVIRSMKMWQRD
jgi:hypothetical protein